MYSIITLIKHLFLIGTRFTKKVFLNFRNLHEKEDFAEVCKNLTNYRSENFVGHQNNIGCSKLVVISKFFAAFLIVQSNYLLDLYLVKFFNISAKSFFLCTIYDHLQFHVFSSISIKRINSVYRIFMWKNEKKRAIDTCETAFLFRNSQVNWEITIPRSTKGTISPSTNCWKRRHRRSRIRRWTYIRLSWRGSLRNRRKTTSLG